MPRLSLGLGIQNSRKVGGKSPIPKSGLSLWLKADAGVTSSQTLYITQVILTGFTGIYSGANGTYNGSSEDQYFGHTSGLFYIEGNTLFDASNDIPIATNSNNYQGAWTPTQYFSTITLSNAGTTSVNGTYTRNDSQFDIEYLPFSKSAGNISWDDELIAWLANNGIIGNDLYRNYSFTFDEDWSIENGAGPRPDATYSNSSRNVGSPTSTITGVYPVNSWADQSGNSRILYPNSGVASSAIISGKNFISFPTYTELISDTAIWSDTDLIIGTIIMVARFQSSGSTSSLFRHDPTMLFARNQQDNLYITIDDLIGGTSDDALSNNTNYLIGTSFDTNLINFYLNGIDNGNLDGQEQYGTAPYIIGGYSGSSSIAEIVVYNRVITTQERQQVEAYLNAKYAIY